jgi:4-hydroxy-tetrahydrodipicolinate synthase
MFREGVTDEGTFAFYDQAIAMVGDGDLRLYLYHFPGISGVAVTPRVIRRLDERHPGMIAGIKDSGGDIDHTEMLLRRFPHLAIFTGSEIHLPELLSTGLRGSICGLANVMPEFLRRMMDQPTAYDRRRFLPQLHTADSILSRQPFVPSAKAVVAADLADPDWRRVMPPLAGIPSVERDRLLADFMRWRANLADLARAS